ncbi:MAG TPA: glycosyltransferase family 39 protein [Pirellulales bacterium]|jgi:hypothetical protein
MASKKPRPATGIAARLRGPLPVVILLACHVVLGATAVARKSMTFDESAHLGGGFSYWAANDYRLHAENGNWSQRLVALPIYLHGYKLAVDDRSWSISDVWGITDRLMTAMGGETDNMLWRARMMMVLPDLALGLLVYFWSRHIFGPVGGLISLTLYAFSPTILANGFLATSDLVAALFFTAATAGIWAVLHRISWLTLGAAIVGVSGLLLSKYSGVLIAPMAVVMLAVRLSSSRPLPVSLVGQHELRGRVRLLMAFVAGAVIVALGAVLIIWASYGFRYAMFGADSLPESKTQIPWENLEGGASPQILALVHFAREHHLLPESYLYGFTYTLFYANQRAGFLNGAFSYKGWTSFFPLCLLWKTPLTLFCITGLAGWTLWARRKLPTGQDSSGDRWPAGRLYQLVPLIVLFAVYWGVAIRSNLNIGHRHILPTYPPMFIFAGAAGLWFTTAVASRATSGKTVAGNAPAQRDVATPPRFAAVARGVTLLLLALGTLETIGFWPNYLAYFNLIAGGPRQGYRRLVDSSLDWGQDLIELKRWLDAHPDDSRDPRRVYLSYFGTAKPEAYGIRAEELPKFFPRWNPTLPAPLAGGLYCISASMLQQVYTVPYVGKWNEQFEKYYQDLRQVVVPFQRAASNPAALQQMAESAPLAELQEAFRVYRVLRFGRLCSFLRQREPDDQVGYSIMIYRLTDADVDAALDGPPCELIARPEGEGQLEDDTAPADESQDQNAAP